MCVVCHSATRELGKWEAKVLSIMCARIGIVVVVRVSTHGQILVCFESADTFE